MDSGSAITLIRTSLANTLKSPGTCQPLVIQWADKTCRTIRNSLCVELNIRGTTEEQSFKIQARTITELDLPTQTLSKETLKNENVTDYRVPTYEHASPEILIGLDNSRLAHPLEVMQTKNLTITKTPLGWAVEGTTKDLPYTNTRSLFINNDELNDKVTKYIEADDLGITRLTDVKESPEDRKALEIMKKNTKRIGERFQTALLWKDDKIEFPNNYRMAIQRLNSFERKLQRKPDLREKVNSLMKNYVDKGYATQIQEKTERSPRTWYLPIFTVENPSKPGKIRVVWDAAAEFDGMSLNNNLLKGPDLLEPLWNVIFRFRQHRFAFCADIAEMYHQIFIKPDDRCSQRFLWRWNQNDPISTLEMNVMTFGAACSPSLAQYVKNVNAREFSNQFPEAAAAIIRNHYVDDWLQSCNTEEEAVRIAKEVIKIQGAAGFQLHKWTSNSNHIMNEILGDTPSSKIASLPKALGMNWDLHSDSFIFDTPQLRIPAELLARSRSPTKREMLSIVMSLFDPLGLVSYATILPRLIMRETWREECEWDESIPDELRIRWDEWMSNLVELEKLRIPRWLQITSPKKELHIFVDASERAIAAVAYVRALENGQYVVSIVASKTRLASLKQKSIPRLELQAAVLGVRLKEMIQSASDYPFTKTILWTDAKDVLWWLKFPTRRYAQFVALRVGDILTHSDKDDWRWIPSKQNPADWATKQNPTGDDNLWWKGPDFLYQQSNHWPETTLQPSPESDREILKILHIQKTEEARIPVIADPERISKWNTLVRATAWALRFAKKMLYNVKVRQKVCHAEDQDPEAEQLPIKRKGPLEAMEIKLAEIELYREAQREFYEEKRCLQLEKQKVFPKSSELHKLSVFLDDDGLIRLKSRNIKAMYLPYDARYPIVLPRKNTITLRLVQHYHELCSHGNSGTALNEMRQKFISSRVRVTFNEVTRNCQKCAVNRTKPVCPQMASHPRCRLAAHRFPFTYTGMDFFGPIEVRLGRRKEKRWGAIFTCLTTRAVHLEVAYSLSKESCIKVIHNFVARRGTPVEFRCDNGTNFVGASKTYKGPNGEQPSWKFNPPAAPHMGGAWERLVRSVKVALEHLSTPHTPTDEELNYFLHQAEFLINSRPLTDVPVADEDAEAITPNHFLLGNSNGSRMPSAGKNLQQELHDRGLMLEQFWTRWIQEYLPTIAVRSKWNKIVPKVHVGDLVFICELNGWKRGVINEVFTDPESDQVRQVIVRTNTGFYKRPVTKIAVIPIINASNKSINECNKE